MYVVVVVLSITGLQLPVILLLLVVGNAIDPPSHTGDNAVNNGVTVPLFTAIVSVVVVAH